VASHWPEARVPVLAKAAAVADEPAAAGRATLAAVVSAAADGLARLDTLESVG